MWNNIGTLEQSRSRFRAAVRAYKKAIELKPALATAWKNLGNAYLALSQFEQAFEALQEAFRLDPTILESQGAAVPAAGIDAATQYFYLAKLLAANGHKDAALDYLRRAKEAGFRDFGPRRDRTRPSTRWSRTRATRSLKRSSRRRPRAAASGPQPFSSRSTCSAIAGAEVRPGESIPTRSTKPGRPRADSSAITKSRKASPGPCSFGRMPAMSGERSLLVDRRQQAADRRREGRAAPFVDAVVERARGEVLDVGPEAQAAVEAQDGVHAEAHLRGHRIHEVREQARGRTRDREIAALAPVLAVAGRVEVDPREGGDGVGLEPGRVHDALAGERLRARRACGSSGDSRGPAARSPPARPASAAGRRRAAPPRGRSPSARGR